MSSDMRPFPILLALSCAAVAADQPANLLKNAGFEEPAVKARTAVENGGNPGSIAEETTSWTHFMAPLKPQESAGGKIEVGLTREYARTGKQSVYVDFQKVTAQKRRSFLMTGLVPVKPGFRYRIGLWGRVDRKRPLSLDQRRAVMKVEAEYFTADQENQAGNVEYRTQMVPGSLDRLLFLSTKWSEYFTTVRAPEDGAFMKVTFRWETIEGEGATDGAIYFDDATVTEIPNSGSLAPVDPATIKPPVVTDPDSPEPAQPAPAPPPAPPAPAK